MGVETVITAGVATALGFGASLLSKGPEKPKAPGSLAGGDKRAPLSRRGSILPLIIGRDRIEPIVAWTGNLKTKKKVVGGGGSAGGKGGGGGEVPETTITTYSEEVIHLLCVGPAFRLHRIWLNEKNVFEGEIDSSSHPSGSTIDLGKYGSLEIWWGGGNDGAHWNSELGVPESEWPYICGVKWKPLELGQQRAHPAIEYDIETRCEFSQLIESESWLEDTWEGTGKEFNVTDVIDGIESEDVAENPIIRIKGQNKKYFKPGGQALLSNNTGIGENIQVEVVKSAYSANVNKTNIYVNEEITGATNDGKIEPLVKVDVGGVNIAHAFCQLLFARFPHGGSFDPGLFDFKSFEEWASLMSETGESLPMRISARDGEQVDSVMTAILEDAGVLIPFVDGAYRFFPVRDDAGPFPNIPAHLIDDPLPEISSAVNLPRVDRAVFWFTDKKRKFAKKTIPKDNDGVADLQEYRQPNEIQMRTVVDSLTGEKVAERRKVEKLARVIPVRLTVGREAGLVFPGQRFTAEGVPFLMRSARIDESFDNTSTRIDATNDFYGHPPSSAVDSDQGFNQDENEDTDPDVAVVLAESTSHTKKKEGIVSIARVRGNDKVGSATIYVSDQDSAGFAAVGEMYTASPGGALLDDMAAGGELILEDGPTFTAMGPDISLALDLTGDDAGWRDGKQLAIFFDPAVPGVVEVCYLRAIEFVSGDTWRMIGLMRARKGTNAIAHDHETTMVVIATPDQIFQWFEKKAVNGATVFVKVSPAGNDGTPLDELLALELPIVGHSIAPPTPLEIRTPLVDMADDLIDLGADSTISWSLRLLDDGQGGAGSFPAGTPYSPELLIGHTNVFIDEPDGGGGWTERRSQIGSAIATTSFIYTTAMVLADFGGDPPDEIRVRVVTVNAGVSRETSRVLTVI